MYSRELLLAIDKARELLLAMMAGRCTSAAYHTEKRLSARAHLDPQTALKMTTAPNGKACAHVTNSQIHKCSGSSLFVSPSLDPLACKHGCIQRDSLPQPPYNT